MNFRRFLSALYWLMLVGFGLTTGTFFWQTYSEYRHLRAAEAVTLQKQKELQLRLQEQEAVLARLKSDPAFVEMQIRQTLGYARSGEYIFRFEE